MSLMLQENAIDALHGLPVLLVDDEPELREIFSLWLQRRGCHVLTAANGVEALACIESSKAAGTPVRALISDQHMPQMNGATMLRELRTRGYQMPALLFVSGFNEMPMREAYSLGVHATLTKPLRRNEMTNALERSLLQPAERWADDPQDSQICAAPTLAALQELTWDLPSLARSQAEGLFQLGCGGCTVASTPELREGPVDLTLRFADGPILRASGCVRWRDLARQRAGVEFLKVPADVRAWLVPAIEALPGCTYIPFD